MVKFWDECHMCVWRWCFEERSENVQHQTQGRQGHVGLLILRIFFTSVFIFFHQCLGGRFDWTLWKYRNWRELAELESQAITWKLALLWILNTFCLSSQGRQFPPWIWARGNYHYIETNSSLKKFLFLFLSLSPPFSLPLFFFFLFLFFPFFFGTQIFSQSRQFSPILDWGIDIFSRPA